VENELTEIITNKSYTKGLGNQIEESIV